MLSRAQQRELCYTTSIWIILEITSVCHLIFYFKVGSKQLETSTDDPRRLSKDLLAPAPINAAVTETQDENITAHLV